MICTPFADACDNSPATCKPNPAMPAPFLYLARHATPDWNRKDIPYDTPPGPPLAPQGEQEAAQLGAWLAGQDVQRLYTSPMLRARQTASIVSAHLHLPVHEMPDVIESRRGERREAVEERMWRFYAHVCANGAGGATVVVSHGFPIDVLLHKLGVPETTLTQMRQRFDHHNPVPCAGAWAITDRGCELVFTPAPRSDP